MFYSVVVLCDCIFFIQCSLSPKEYVPCHHLQSCGKSELVRQTHCHLRVFQHVREADGADGVLCGVNVLACVFKRALDDKSRWVPGLGRTRVVRTCVAAFGLDVGNGAILVVVNQWFLSHAICGLTAVTTFLMKLVSPTST
jgi:hypothetical protein